MKRFSSPHTPWKIGFLFLICVLISFGIRTCSYNREAANLAITVGDAEPLWHGTFYRNRPASAGWGDVLPGKRPNFIPYTVESAMMFAYAEDVAFRGGVPERDPRLAYLPDVPPYAQMNMSLEWVLGWSYRILSLFRTPPEPAPDELRYQDHPDFAWFVSWNVRLWTSLLSGLVFLWLIVLRVPPKLAFAGGILHGVSAAAVARATGQDIVRGDFCIPLIICAIILAESLFRKPGRFRLLLLFAVTFLAFAAWDLCQMMFGIWAAFEVFRYLCGGKYGKERRQVWIVISAAILLNALLIPFNVTYGLIMSKLVCILLPLLFLVMYLPPMRFWKRAVSVLAVWMLLAGFYHIAVENPAYLANYSHFSSVMKAKVRYLNIKPPDPSKLDYDARIMWTPSMHSCTWQIAAGYFPSLGSIPELRMYHGLQSIRNLWNFYPLTLGFFYLLLLLGGLGTPVRTAILRDRPRNLFPFLLTIGFTGGFAYVVRYHEFLILFLSVSLPLLIQEWFHGLGNRRKKTKIFLSAILIFLLFFEFLVTTSARSRAYGTVDSYLPQTVKLIRWFRQDRAVEGKTAAASFTLSPVLMAYTGMNLIMQPQFGMEPIRRPVEEFLMLMYHGSLEELETFCERYGTDYLIYDRGMSGPMHPFSSRYIANAETIKPDSPVNIMERRKQSMRRFVPLVPPDQLKDLSMKYTVFQFVKQTDLDYAEDCLIKAQNAIAGDDLDTAEDLVLAGLKRDPGSEKLARLYRMLFRKEYQARLRK